MLRAIELALKGTGAVNPNPLVGAVIVKNGEIISEGYHRKYGSLHAERDALSRAEKDVTGADMYVTLEPCCHHGKQPPCTEAIINSGIKRVFVGSSDPNPLVAGKGIEILRQNDIEVVENVLKDKCDEINKVFFHYITTKTPYVVMKYAMTMDGKIACENGESKWITCEKSRESVQYLRHSLTGIMVGIGTVLKDNPRLNCRIEGGRNPVRIICDSHLKIPLESNIVSTAGDIKTIVACCCENKEKEAALKEKGVNIIHTPEKNGKVDIKFLMEALGEMAVDSVLLEGGSELNYAVLSEGVVNKVMVYMSPKILGGNGKTPVGGKGVLTPDDGFKFKRTSIKFIDDDILLEYEKEV